MKQWWGISGQAVVDADGNKFGGGECKSGTKDGVFRLGVQKQRFDRSFLSCEHCFYHADGPASSYCLSTAQQYFSGTEVPLPL